MPPSVLIADDEPGIRALVESELALNGYQVTAAADGWEAMERIRASEFDLVISDVRMPGPGGVEVLKAVKHLSPDTEVVIATGYAELDQAIECLRAGAFDFLQKPFHLVDLVATAARAIERRQLRSTAALYQTSQAIFAAAEPSLVPDAIVASAMKILGADDVSLMLPGADGKLYIAHSHSLSAELQAEVRLEIGERIAGRVAASREPALIADGLLEDPRFADVKSFGRVRSSIIYPLVAGERLVGVLNISRITDERPFRRADVERASVVASQALLALENSRLFQRALASERLAAVGQLAAGVAHEINNPLAYVIANHQSLQQGLDELAGFDALLAKGQTDRSTQEYWSRCGGGVLIAEMKRTLEDAQEGASQIRDIARDLRTLAARDERLSAVVDLNETIRSALRVASAELRGRARVSTRLQNGVEVVGSPGRLTQVFVNLLVNAAQAVAERPAEDPQIAIASRREGEWVTAQISDSGPGIAPEHLPSLFEAFFTTKESGRGTGLGLSISRDIVRQHGGEILVESVRGRGATFTVTLPAAARAT